MAQSKIIRRDLSNDPEAPAKAISNPEFRAALLDFGFTTVGFYETSAPGWFTQKQLEQHLAPADAAFLFNGLEKGQISEIFGNSDKNTFAEIDTQCGETILVFITITQDGTLIDTTMKPTRAMQASERIAGAPKTTIFNLFSQLAAKRRKLQFGLPPIWARSNRPKAGYHLELVKTRNPKVLWLRHQTRQIEILKPNQEIPLHNKLELYFCTLKRMEKVLEYLGSWQGRLYIANIVFSIMIAGLLIVEELLIFWPLMPYISIVVPMIVLLISYLGIEVIRDLGYMFIRETILPDLPGPKLESVSTLMSQVSLTR